MTLDSLAYTSAKGRIRLRLAKVSDLAALVDLNKLAYPAMAEEDQVWTRAHLAQHQKVFPEGQIVAELDGRLVGAVSTLIVHMGLDPYRPHTYAGITDGGYFHNHDPQGDTLYGADVYVHPETRGLGVGAVLYEARRQLCKARNLKRILAGGRLHGYSEYVDRMTPDQYVSAVERGELFDSVLSFQLREGFVVRGILRHYLFDPHSRNFASLIEWENPDYTPVDSGERKARVACVQYQVRSVRDFESFAEQVEYFVETASDYRSDFLLFPEFFSVQLLSQKSLRHLDSRGGIAHLAGMEREFMELMKRMATQYGLHIIAGSHPIERDGRLYNACPILFPDGSFALQPKIHITPAERKYWGITGGSELRVFHTPKAKIGVLICYDSEFPEAARYLADEGAEILFVPYCTDDRPAHKRVAVCSQARAVENQVFVATSGIIGNLPSVPAMDIHYGKSAVYTPNDFAFARDGIQAVADSNVEMLLVTDLDINDLHRSRVSGSVRQRLDRRTDLFEFRAKVSNEVGDLLENEQSPLPPHREPEDEERA